MNDWAPKMNNQRNGHGQKPEKALLSIYPSAIRKKNMVELQFKLQSQTVLEQSQLIVARTKVEGEIARVHLHCAIAERHGDQSSVWRVAYRTTLRRKTSVDRTLLTEI